MITNFAVYGHNNAITVVNYGALQLHSQTKRVPCLSNFVTIFHGFNLHVKYRPLPSPSPSCRMGCNTRASFMKCIIESAWSSLNASRVGESSIFSEMSGGLVQRIPPGQSMLIVNKYISALQRANYQAGGASISLSRPIHSKGATKRSKRAISVGATR